jgi:hypothetical protein
MLARYRTINHSFGTASQISFASKSRSSNLDLPAGPVIESEAPESKLDLSVLPYSTNQDPTMSSEELEHEQLQKSLELLRSCGDDPEACRQLPPDQRLQLVGMKLIFFGLEPTAEEAQAATTLYAMLCEEASPDERRKLLSTTTDFVEQNQGNGIPAIWVFLAVDPDASIRSEASLIFSVLHPQTEGDAPYTGVRTILNYLEKQAQQDQDVAAAFHGLLNIGDERLVDDLLATWKKFPVSSQIESAKYPPNIPTHAFVEFFLRQLEAGCSDELYGNICGLLARLPSLAIEERTGILDIERDFPAYSSDEPIKVLEQWTVGDYLEFIRPRLEQLAENETEPKVLPRLIDIWEEAASLDAE